MTMTTTTTAPAPDGRHVPRLTRAQHRVLLLMAQGALLYRGTAYPVGRRDVAMPAVTIHALVRRGLMREWTEDEYAASPHVRQALYLRYVLTDTGREVRFALLERMRANAVRETARDDVTPDEGRQS